MQVYSWFEFGGKTKKSLKRPHTPWLAAELEGIPNKRSISQGIFDELVLPDGAPVRTAKHRVGICSNLSPSIGVYQSGMAELSRRDAGNQVEVSWVRGFWDSLHIIHRAPTVPEVGAFARALIERTRAAGREANVLPDIDLAGQGKMYEAPYYVFLLVGRGVYVSGRRRIDQARARAGEVV